MSIWRDLLEAADLYVNKCTRQYEKFDYYRRNGAPYTWADCEAAYAMLREVPGYWQMMDDWRRRGVYPADDWTPQ